MIVSNCQNCDTRLDQSFDFCPTCSQKAETHRLALGEIGHEIFHAATHADKGILFLLKELILRPGTVIREYVEGKRKKYFNPFSFFIIVVGIYVFSNTMFHTFDQPLDLPKSTTVSTNTAVNPKQTKMVAIGKRIRNVQHFMNTKTNLILFISAPFFALVFFGLYRKKRKNYAEHLVAMIFIDAMLSLLTTFIFGPLIYFTKPFHIYYLWLVLMLLVHVIYIGISYHGWMNYPKQLKYYLKCTGNGLVGVICWSIVTMLAITIYIATA
jgi:hypothetical protein